MNATIIDRTYDPFKVIIPADIPDGTYFKGRVGYTGYQISSIFLKCSDNIIDICNHKSIIYRVSDLDLTINNYEPVKITITLENP